jgi:hypothetical protein
MRTDIVAACRSGSIVESMPMLIDRYRLQCQSSATMSKARCTLASPQVFAGDSEPSA